MNTVARAIGCLTVFLVLGLPISAAAPEPGTDIASDEELNLVVRQLQDPATEMAALSRLIAFSNRSMHMGSMFLTSGDTATDQRCKKARRAIWETRTPERIRRALDSGDRTVRFWAAHLFDGNRKECGPWETFAPRLREMAQNDPDAGIRAAAIAALLYDEASRGVVESLRTSGKESDPWVLMRLFQFDDTRGEGRSQWYAQAVKFLSSADEATRLLWLQVISGNTCNPSTADMWRVQADPSLLEALRKVEKAGSNQEKECARNSIKALTEGYRWGPKPQVPSK